MLDTGFKSPTSNGGTWDHWTNPENAYASDDAYATRLDDSGNFRIQSYENFSFGIPAGAYINGIEIKAEGYADAGIGYVNILCGLIDDAGTGITYVQDSLTVTEETLTFGSSTFKFYKGYADATLFSNDNFFAIFGTFGGNTGVTVYLDHIQVKVYYTPFEAKKQIITI